MLPIIHDHKSDYAAAQRHCLSLAKGGWAVKVVRPAGSGWQVHITGYRGFNHQSH
jgi:hypothetical protein